MKVGLFIPCYVDQFYPQVGISTLELLEKFGCQITYPKDQTCCGQPMANSGCEQESIAVYHHFVKNFKDFEYIVTPSGSCAYHVKEHYDIIDQTGDVKSVRNRIVDLGKFLVDILKIEKLESHFPYRVGLHQSCHGLRGLRLGQSSELINGQKHIYKSLLSMVSGLELVNLERVDECCGFGGTFAINEPSISVKMGVDHIQDHLTQEVEVITGGDMSCLMHMEGLIRRNGLNIRIKHIAEILNGVAS
jgi:L-lactate dehydrogenase complex protein LldE